jgi:hypothetical protein
MDGGRFLMMRVGIDSSDSSERIPAARMRWASGMSYVLDGVSGSMTVFSDAQIVSSRESRSRPTHIRIDHRRMNLAVVIFGDERPERDLATNEGIVDFGREQNHVR